MGAVNQVQLSRVRFRERAENAVRCRWTWKSLVRLDRAQKRINRRIPAIGGRQHRLGRLDPLGELAGRLGEIPRDKPIVMQCQGGSRSAIAASLLDAEGVGDVANLTGGFGAWEKAGNRVVK